MKSRHLSFILADWDIILLLFVGIGVGVACVLGVMKYTYGWSMKKLISYPHFYSRIDYLSHLSISPCSS